MNQSPDSRGPAGDTSSTVAVPPPAEGSGATRTWRVGTLTYTSSGIVVLFCWLLWGDFAWNIKDRSVNDVMKLVLRLEGASDFLVALLIFSIPLLLTVLIAPVVSYKSDRHRGRWGRRIPFLLIPTPIAAASMTLLAFGPSVGRKLDVFLGANSPGTAACVLIVLGVAWGIFEASTIIVNTLFGALINDVVPQELLGRFFGLFRAVSVGCGIVFNWYLLGKAEAWYIWIFLGLAIIYGVGFSLMCLKVKEGQYPPPPPAVRSKDDLPLMPPGMKQYFRECFSHPYYLLIFASLGMVSAGMAPGGLYALFFAKSLDLDLDTFGKIGAIAFAASFFLAYPLGWLADKFHPVRLGFVIVAAVTVLNLLMGLLAVDKLSFAVGHAILVVISGSYLTVTASITQRLFPRSKFAQYASALAILLSLVTLPVGPIVGYILDQAGHNYRLAYLISSGLLLVATILWGVMWARFNRYGGVAAYRAPNEQ